MNLKQRVAVIQKQNLTQLSVVSPQLLVKLTNLMAVMSWAKVAKFSGIAQPRLIFNWTY
jgi:hypothetical protein